jgi:hypothetical protein
MPRRRTSGDKEAFERARAWLQKRSELQGYVVAFGIAAAAVGFVVLARLNPGVKLEPLAIALAFAATSAIAGIQLYRNTG